MSVPDFSAFGLVLEPVPDFEDWFQGPTIDREVPSTEGEALAAQLRASPAAKGFLVLLGVLDYYGGLRVYVIPPISPREVVRTFGVGAHGGHSAETADREVGARLEAAHRICPFTITFADSAGLHAEFTSPLDEAAAIKIEEVFTTPEDAMDCGLEGYESEWSGEGLIMAPTMLAEQGLRLWWD